MDGCGLKKICFIYRYDHTYLHKFRLIEFTISNDYAYYKQKARWLLFKTIVLYLV